MYKWKIFFKTNLECIAVIFKNKVCTELSLAIDLPLDELLFILLTKISTWERKALTNSSIWLSTSPFCCFVIITFCGIGLLILGAEGLVTSALELCSSSALCLSSQRLRFKYLASSGSTSASSCWEIKFIIHLQYIQSVSFISQNKNTDLIYQKNVFTKIVLKKKKTIL